MAAIKIKCFCMKCVILYFNVLQLGGTYVTCFSFYRMFSYGEFKAEDQVIIHLTAMAFYRQGKITVTMKYWKEIRNTRRCVTIIKIHLHLIQCFPAFISDVSFTYHGRKKCYKCWIRKLKTFIEIVSETMKQTSGRNKLSFSCLRQFISTIWLQLCFQVVPAGHFVTYTSQCIRNLIMFVS